MSGAFWRRCNGRHRLSRPARFDGGRFVRARHGALGSARQGSGPDISRLLGRCRDAMPAYRSGGLRLSLSIDELQREAAGFVEQGFRAMKMSLGKPLADDDRARVAAVREAIGPNVRLMTDSQPAVHVAEAIRRGRALEEFNLAWIEEPVPYHDSPRRSGGGRRARYAGRQRRNEYTRAGMLEMLRPALGGYPDAGSATHGRPDRTAECRALCGARRRAVSLHLSANGASRSRARCRMPTCWNTCRGSPPSTRPHRTGRERLRAALGPPRLGILV